MYNKTDVSNENVDLYMSFDTQNDYDLTFNTFYSHWINK